MSTIHKQLVTDEEGRPVGVLIPYEEWLRIEQHEDNGVRHEY